MCSIKLYAFLFFAVALARCSIIRLFLFIDDSAMMCLAPSPKERMGNFMIEKMICALKKIMMIIISVVGQ